MAKKFKCKHCGEYKEESIKLPIGRFCGYDHATEWAKNKSERDLMRKMNKESKEKEKAARERHRRRKKEVKPIKEWQDKLQRLVNQYVMQVLRKGEACISCGNPNPTEAGHFLSRGAHPNKRYLLDNIFPQCHTCNVYKSGNAGEYEKVLIERFGADFVDSIRMHNELLKDKFPHWEDYEVEIKRYRQLLRENGIKPAV